jgi:signal transduction histidine kinase/ligand-binding sensor domain-containing protein
LNQDAITGLKQIKYWIACVLVMGLAGARAEYRFDVWTADSGLPQNDVRTIVQTRDGYLWVGTLDGLARFDGVRFTVFNKGNSPGLSGNHATALYEDREGALWIGLGDGGLSRYHLGKFSALTTRDGLPGLFPWTITADERGKVWLWNMTNALYWSEGKFLPALPNEPSLFPYASRAGARSVMQWAIAGDKVQIYSRGKLTTLTHSSGLPRSHIYSVDEDQNGNWWLATEEEGLVKMRDGKVVKTYTEREGLPRNKVEVGPGSIALEDRKGNLWLKGVGPWLGRLNDGIFTAYPSADTLSSQPLPAGEGPSGQVHALFEDKEGNLWIGTQGRGLIRAREQIVNMISTRHGLSLANIYPVLEDRAGAIWIGTWGKGPARIKSGVVTNFGSESWVTAYCEDRSGRLWVGTIGAVQIFQDEKLSKAGVPTELTNQTVSAICEDRNGVLWFGAERGLFSYQNGEASCIQREGVPGFISVIIEDRSGSLSIGGRGGLTRLANGRVTTWTEKDGLPGNRVVALHHDSDGTLWIGTPDSGLGRFRDGQFTRYTTKDGMFDNGVFQILEDDSGNFWMSSNRGIHRVNKRELNEFAEGRRRSITSIAYGKSDGMFNAECNGGRWPAGVKTRDGKLWFPTQDGVAVIDPAALPTNPHPPNAAIEAFVLDRKLQPLDGPLRVPPGNAGNIEIQYSGLSFVNSERIAFKYRLTPSDDDWVEAGTRRAAFYSHLAPGNYTFSVLAANSDRVWGNTGASLAFVVLPAWHQTFWFRALAAFVLCAVAVGLVQLRLRSVEWRRAAQEAFSRELIRQQEAERKRIASELHDGLGQALLVIKNTASLASTPSLPAEARQDFAAIGNLSGKALEDLRSISHALRPPELDRLGLTKALEHAVNLVADAAGLRFSVQMEPLDGRLAPEAEIHLYRLVQESLNNVVKHAQASFVEIRAWSGDGFLRCSVRDNGEGFDPASLQAGSTTRRGLGLAGMTERVRLLGGQISIHSQPGSGTLVEARLPIQLKNRT